MPDVNRQLILSSRADHDLAKIAEYTIKHFGIEQARHYRDGLDNLLESLLQYPLLGRPAAEFAPKLRRIVYEEHVIFYVPSRNKIRVARILGQNMDAERHL